MSIFLKGAVVLLTLLQLLPVAIMYIITRSTPFEEDKSVLSHIFRLELLINVVVNLFVFFVVAAECLDTRNSFAKIGQIFLLNCSYQDIGALVKVSVICVCISAAVAFGIRRFFYMDFWLELSAQAKGAMLLLFVVWVPVLIAGQSISFNGVKNIVIDEVCRKTTTQVKTTVPGEVRDIEISYVTLYNRGALSCDLSRVYLSESEDDLQKYIFRDITVPANGTYQIDMNYNRKLDFHKSGDTIVYLASAAGELLDSVVVPALAEEESYYRLAAESDIWEIQRLVETAEPVIVPAPTFSAQAGFYDDAFDLYLYAGSVCSIYYTLDGSTPTAEATLYQQPIHVYDRSAEPNRYRSIQNVRTDYKNHSEIGTTPVDKAFIVRAAAIDDAGNTSEVVTATYFVNLNQYRNDTVVSLVADPDDLFDPERGIYVTGAEYDAWYEEHLAEILALPKSKAQQNVDADGKRLPSIWDSEPTPNFMQRGDEWEREANFEFFKNRQETISQSAGIKIAGSSSRDVVLKRFSVFSRKLYSGNKLFDSPIFEGKGTHSIALRDGFSNAFIPTLVMDRDVAWLNSFSVNVFLNGEFWYTTYLCEKYNTSYFSETFGINESNVDFIKIGYWSRLNAEEKAMYAEAITDYLNNHDMSEQFSLDEFNRKVDVQSYIDFTCVNVFVDNEDTLDTLNGLLWRTELKENDNSGDGRWRWGLFDLDLQQGQLKRVQGVDHNYEVNTFVYHRDNRTAYIEQPIYAALRKNATFCKQFVLTFMDLVNTNFKAETVLEKLEEWGNTSSTYRDFFANRSQYIVPYMAEEFDLTGTLETVTITTNDPAGGKVTLNTITPDLSEGEWTGEYYTDYPVTVTAEANDGYRFVGWRINSKNVPDSSAEAAVRKGGTTIHAIFEQQ